MNMFACSNVVRNVLLCLACIRFGLSSPLLAADLISTVAEGHKDDFDTQPIQIRLLDSIGELVFVVVDGNQLVDTDFRGMLVTTVPESISSEAAVPANDDPAIDDPSKLANPVASVDRVIDDQSLVQLAFYKHPNNSAAIDDPSKIRHVNDNALTAQITLVVDGVPAVINANNNPSIDDPSKIQDTDWIGEVVVINAEAAQFSVAVSENENDSPAVNDPSMIRDKDYVGILIIVPHESDQPPGVQQDNDLQNNYDDVARHTNLIRTYLPLISHN